MVFAFSHDLPLRFSGMYVVPPPFPRYKIHGANMGPTWVLSAPDGPYVGPMYLAVREFTISYILIYKSSLSVYLTCLHEEVHRIGSIVTDLCWRVRNRGGNLCKLPHYESNSNPVDAGVSGTQ